MTFTIGRGTDIVSLCWYARPHSSLVPEQVCAAIKEVAGRIVGKDTETMFFDMGKTWDYLLADPQLRWCVAPVHIAFYQLTEFGLF